MKAIVVAVFLVGALVAGAFIAGVNPVAADGPPHKAQWQYQCFEADGVAQVTERANKMGEQGWELVTSAGQRQGLRPCGVSSDRSGSLGSKPQEARGGQQVALSELAPGRPAPSDHVTAR